MLHRLLLGLILALALTGCGSHSHDHDYNDEPYGYVRIEFGTGYAETSYGWYYSSVTTSLVVDALAIEYGEAEVVDCYWSIVDYPVYAPALSHPYSSTTRMTFATSGVYVLDHHVRYEVDGNLFWTVERLEVHILPSGVG